MEPKDSPIIYPVIDIPGKGKFTVKYGLGAGYVAEQVYGMDQAAVVKKIQEWVPKKQLDADGNPVLAEDGSPVTTPGKVGTVFLFDILAACLPQLRMSGLEIAQCFEHQYQIADVAKAVAEAFAKTQWLAQTPAQESATAPGQTVN
jgi:hypothetical protein